MDNEPNNVPAVGAPDVSATARRKKKKSDDDSAAMASHMAEATLAAS